VGQFPTGLAWLVFLDPRQEQRRERLAVQKVFTSSVTAGTESPTLVALAALV
jgi:hypothetical protein